LEPFIRSCGNIWYFRSSWNIWHFWKLRSCGFIRDVWFKRRFGIKRDFRFFRKHRFFRDQRFERCLWSIGWTWIFIQHGNSCSPGRRIYPVQQR
jgi:hypothetical protein